MGVSEFTSARDRLLNIAHREVFSNEVCAEIAAAVAEVAPCDAAAVMNTDPETNLPAGGVVTGFDASQCAPFWDNELLDPDFLKFNDLARSLEPIGTLAEATDGDLDRSPRFAKLYADFDAIDELRVAFVSGRMCHGIGSFVRCSGQPFTATEIHDVRHLLVPATNALRQALTRSVDSVDADLAPVVVLLNSGLQLVSATPGIDAVLDDLRLADLEGAVPGTLLVAASKAQSGREAVTISTRSRGHSGRWYRVHAARMSDDDGSVAVTIEGARPGDLVSILLDAYELTERETEVVMALCRGAATKEIAADFHLSVHTVRDHLKSIFDKAGVNSRGELVARLFTSHLIGRFESSVEHIN